MKSTPTCYRAIETYESPYPEQLVFSKGEEVVAGEEFSGDPDWQGWVWCETARQIKAWVPKQFIEIVNQKTRMNRDYNARELSVKSGDELLVYELINGFGFAEKLSGERGWVPIKCLEKVVK